MQCPACQGERTVQDRLLDQIGGGLVQVFRPKGLTMITVTGSDVRIPPKEGFMSCLECGLLWCRLDKAELEAVLARRGNQKTRERLGLSDGLMTKTRP